MRIRNGKIFSSSLFVLFLSFQLLLLDEMDIWISDILCDSPLFCVTHTHHSGKVKDIIAMIIVLKEHNADRILARVVGWIYFTDMITVGLCGPRDLEAQVFFLIKKRSRV
jgi:hypothetical protein